MAISCQWQSLLLHLIILPSHYTQKTDINDKLILDFTPDRKTMLGSTNTTAAPLTLTLYFRAEAQVRDAQKSGNRKNFPLISNLP